ncbi:MAG TPA: hypothetical protein VHI52_05135, partial [Verrucomicrobiae bacterium]|nr:hypothetical protein [Verrucomicrobiae bacterium]
LECANFIESIREGTEPVTDGKLGLEVVRILEAANLSLKQQGACITLDEPAAPRGKGDLNGQEEQTNGRPAAAPVVERGILAA